MVRMGTDSRKQLLGKSNQIRYNLDKRRIICIQNYTARKNVFEFYINARIPLI